LLFFDSGSPLEALIKDRDLRKKLPLEQPVSFDFTPHKTGEMTYVRGMGMVSGLLLVQ
jgi:plastocyanin domain-containing protein